MFDLNGLLSTLLGGILTIAGGFAGSYFLQTISNKREKRKEIKDMIDKLFQDIQYILYAEIEYFNLSQEQKYIEYKELKVRLFRIQTLVNLYLTPLENEFNLYFSGVLDF